MQRSEPGAGATTPHPLSTRTLIEFDIAQGLVVGTGFIADADHDDGWLYRIDIERISQGDVSMHLDADGHLWVCEFELHSLERDQP